MCLHFCTKGGYSFRRFNTEKARLPIFSLVLGTTRCLEMDDLRVLEISDDECESERRMLGTA